MDLAKFAQMPPVSGGTFLKFTPNDNVKIVRFLYPSTPGVDEDLGIQCRQKLYDNATKKVVWDTPDGKWTMTLKVAVYSSKQEFTMMSWDRSAVFGRDILIPLFEAAGGRICDQVYKVTCTKAGTLDAAFSFFPLRDSDTYAMPNLSAEVSEDPSQGDVAQPTPNPTPAQSGFTAPNTPKQNVGTANKAQPSTPPKKRNFWDEDA